MAITILRLPAVKARTGLSRSNIYLKVSEGRFPEAVSLGSRAVGWIESEIDTWLAERVEASRPTDQNDYQVQDVRPNPITEPERAEDEGR